MKNLDVNFHYNLTGHEQIKAILHYQQRLLCNISLILGVTG